MDDRELLAAWRGGDARAGERLFERHFDAVFRFFRNKIDDGPEDLVQATFLGCLEARDRFRGDASFRTFVFSVAKNVLWNHYRSRQKDARRVDFSVDSAYGLIPSPSVVVAQHREAQDLLEALRRIPVEYQIALELHYWEDMSASELAAVEDIPLGTAKTRLRRGRALLIEALAALDPKAPGPVEDDQVDARARALRTVVLR